MKRPLILIICVIALLGACLCALAVWRFRGIPGLVKVEVSRNYKPAAQNANPLLNAIDSTMSDQEFESLVKHNPQYIAQKERRIGKRPLEYSILSDCVLARKTNLAKILIRHGADVEECRTFFTTSIQDEESLEFLTQVQADVASTAEEKSAK